MKVDKPLNEETKTNNTASDGEAPVLDHKTETVVCTFHLVVIISNVHPDPVFVPSTSPIDRTEIMFKMDVNFVY